MSTFLTQSETRDPGSKVRPAKSLWSRLFKVFLSIVAILVIASAIASRITVSVFAITPGEAQSVAGLEKVPKPYAHPLHGQVLLTDVYLTHLNALNYLYYRLDTSAQLFGSETLTGPDIPTSELTAQGFIEMSLSQSNAKAAALQTLGYQVGEKPGGDLIFGIIPGSPAWSKLKVGQIIRAVNGVVTPNSCALLQAMKPVAPGQIVKLSVEQSVVTSKAQIKPGPIKTVSLRTAKRPDANNGELTSTGCTTVPVAGPSYLGIERDPGTIGTLTNYSMPIKLTIATTTIGGPSAGLAMTLGLIDRMSGGDLTGGLKVAATGTINEKGNIGPIGGAREKAIAVENAGATIFLVPAGSNYETAMEKDNSSLKIYPVSSLSQAISILEKHGGKIVDRRATTP